MNEDESSKVSTLAPRVKGDAFEAGQSEQAVSDFVDLITSMSGFLNGVGLLEAFDRQTPTAVIDWVILSTISKEPPGLTERQMCHLIGASFKRTRRVIARLAQAGLVSVQASSKPEIFVVEATSLGQAHLQKINESLGGILHRFLARNPSQIGSAVRLVRRFGRLLDRAEDTSSTEQSPTKED